MFGKTICSIGIYFLYLHFKTFYHRLKTKNVDNMLCFCFYWYSEAFWRKWILDVIVLSNWQRWAGEMAQWVKLLAIKLNKLNGISVAHGIEKQSRLLLIFRHVWGCSCKQYTCNHSHTHIYMHSHTHILIHCEKFF